MKSDLSSLVNKLVKKPLATAAMLAMTAFPSFSQDASGVIKVTDSNGAAVSGKDITMETIFEGSRTEDVEQFQFTTDEHGIFNYASLPLPIRTSVSEQPTNLPQIGDMKVTSNGTSSAPTVFTYIGNQDRAVASVYDVSGRLVTQQEVEVKNGFTKNYVDLSNEASGIYVYTLETSDGKGFSQKLMNKGPWQPEASADPTSIFNITLSELESASQISSNGRSENNIEPNYKVFIDGGFGLTSFLQHYELQSGVNDTIFVEMSRLADIYKTIQGTVNADSAMVIAKQNESNIDTVFAQNGEFSFAPILLKYDQFNELGEVPYELFLKGNFIHQDSAIVVNKDLEPIDFTVVKPQGQLSLEVLLNNVPVDSANINIVNTEQLTYLGEQLNLAFDLDVDENGEVIDKQYQIITTSDIFKPDTRNVIVSPSAKVENINVEQAHGNFEGNVSLDNNGSLSSGRVILYDGSQALDTAQIINGAYSLQDKLIMFDQNGQPINKNYSLNFDPLNNNIDQETVNAILNEGNNVVNTNLNTKRGNIDLVFEYADDRKGQNTQIVYDGQAAILGEDGKFTIENVKYGEYNVELNQTDSSYVFSNRTIPFVVEKADSVANIVIDGSVAPSFDGNLEVLLKNIEEDTLLSNNLIIFNGTDSAYFVSGKVNKAFDLSPKADKFWEADAENVDYEVQTGNGLIINGQNGSFVVNEGANQEELQAIPSRGTINFTFKYADDRNAQNAQVDYQGQAAVLGTDGKFSIENVLYGNHSVQLNETDSSYNNVNHNIPFVINQASKDSVITLDGTTLPEIYASFIANVEDGSNPLEHVQVKVGQDSVLTNASGQAIIENIQLINDATRFWDKDLASKNVQVYISPTENSEEFTAFDENKLITGLDSLENYIVSVYPNFFADLTGRITDNNFGENIPNAQIILTKLNDPSVQYNLVTDASGDYNVSGVPIDRNEADPFVAKPTQYIINIAQGLGGSLEYKALIDTLTLNNAGGINYGDAIVESPKQHQDLTVYTYDETSKLLLPNTNIILREKGTGTELYNQNSGLSSVTIFENIPAGMEIYFDMPATATHYGKTSEEFSFATPDEIRVFADTVRQYINRALPQKISGVSAADLNEMIPETPNLGMFIVSGDGKTQSAIYLPNPDSALYNGYIQSGASKLGLPEVRISATPRSMSEADIMNQYHPVNNPLEGEIITDAEYTGTSTSKVNKTIVLPYQTLEIIAYADPFRISGETATEKETFGRLYGYRDVSESNRLMSTISAGINTGNVKDMGITKITNENIQAALKHQDGNGNPIESYITIWKPTQAPYRD